MSVGAVGVGGAGGIVKLAVHSRGNRNQHTEHGIHVAEEKVQA